MGDGGGFLSNMFQIIVGLILLGMVLGALQQALCQVMPGIVIIAAVVGAVWLIVVIIRRGSRW